MIILGPLFPEVREREILSASRQGISNAAYNFQWNMLKGIQANTEERLIVINALPVGTWPQKYQTLRLRDADWTFGTIVGHEIGGWNIPIVKQVMRMRKTLAWLKRYPEETEILIFTAYLPFLWAASQVSPKRHVTAVITDIPEFYDIHQVSAFRKLLRKLHCKIVYHFLASVERFVLLTKQMADPLHVGRRLYIVMEGMCGAVADEMKEPKRPPFSLLYTGRLNRRYGLEMLLTAVRGLDDPDIALWLCGSGEMEEEIRAYAEEDERIKFFGFLPHEETVRLQQKATVLVNPRTNQGEYTKYSFPSKTLEYMAAGRPVMMFHLDGIPKEYDPYLTYIPEESADSLCETIGMLKEMEPEELDALGSRGREFVQRYKNRNAQMRRVLNLIHEERRDT